ncbi:MAG: response regulator transcription factor [Chloroflexota bacterium]|nr:response regulator transcription factor [Chloroflexota bacterium]
MGKRILIVDDDAALVKVLSLSLEREGFEVIAALGGAEALRRAYESRPDLVVLDIMMPRMDGWATCRRLREISDMPIIMLTAKGDETDIVRGLDLGADDYITKPCSSEELKARIRALLRRSQTTDRNDWQVAYDDGWLKIDLSRQQVTVNGEPVDLTPTEFRLLACLIQRNGQVVPHKQLLTEVWGPEYSDQVSYLSVYIRYLRQKIEQNPSQPAYILTKWGMGYRFAGAEE